MQRAPTDCWGHDTWKLCQSDSPTANDTTATYTTICCTRLGCTLIVRAGSRRVSNHNPKTQILFCTVPIYYIHRYRVVVDVAHIHVVCVERDIYIVMCIFTYMKFSINRIHFDPHRPPHTYTDVLIPIFIIYIYIVRRSR